MSRWGVLACLLALLAAPRGFAFTEPEDRPFLDLDGSEDNPVAAPEKVPFTLSSFMVARPDRVIQIRGQLGALDRDVYTLQLNSGQLLFAGVFEPGGGARHDLQLGVFVPAASVPLALEDDAGEGFLPALAQPITQTGTWKVGVTGFGDNAFTGAHQEAPGGLVPYELVLAVGANPPAHRDRDLSPGPQGSNDSAATAQALPREGALLHASLLPGDVDYFSLSLEQGDVLTIAVVDLTTGQLVSPGGERNDAIVGLFEPGGPPVPPDGDDEGPGLLPVRRFSAHTTGPWSVAVSAFGDASFTGAHQQAAFDYALVASVSRGCPSVAHLMTILTPPPSGNPYAVADLDEGDHYYTDRTNAGAHVLTDLPAEVRCAQWIKTANDDKSRTETNFLPLHLSQATRLYVGYDTRATSPPTWLASAFTNTGQIIDVEDPDPVQEFTLFRRNVGGGPVTLGANRAPGSAFPAGVSGSSYVVAAVPFATPEGRLPLSGTAQGGNVRVTTGGVLIQVNTIGGQSAAQVAAALAAAINANTTLQSQGISALTTGGTLEVSSPITQTTINDPGLAGAPIPALPSPLWVALLGASLLLALRTWRLAR